MLNLSFPQYTALRQLHAFRGEAGTSRRRKPGSALPLRGGRQTNLERNPWVRCCAREHCAVLRGGPQRCVPRHPPFNRLFFWLRRLRRLFGSSEWPLARRAGAGGRGLRPCELPPGRGRPLAGGSGQSGAGEGCLSAQGARREAAFGAGLGAAVGCAGEERAGVLRGECRGPRALFAGLPAALDR